MLHTEPDEYIFSQFKPAFVFISILNCEVEIGHILEIETSNFATYEPGEYIFFRFKPRCCIYFNLNFEVAIGHMLEEVEILKLATYDRGEDEISPI